MKIKYVSSKKYEKNETKTLVRNSKFLKTFHFTLCLTLLYPTEQEIFLKTTKEKHDDLSP